MKPFIWSGENIRRLRIHYLRMTQEQFAARLEVSAGAVKSWETGRTKPININQIKSAFALRKLDSLGRDWQFEEAPGETTPSHVSHIARRKPRSLP